MKIPLSVAVFVIFVINGEQLTGATEANTKQPAVLILTLFRNKAHILPYFFSYLERLDYPKNRISLWFRSDHNEDNTTQILHSWLYLNSYLYHNVDFEYEAEPERRTTEESPTHWPEERHLDVIRLKEEGFNYARRAWADYIFFLDADVLLVDSNTLTKLMAIQVPIIAPMLISDSLYSNFWCGMSADFYYERKAEYKEIYGFEKQGKFAVPMIHSAVLVNLNDIQSDRLTFNRTILTEKLTTGTAPNASLLHNVPIDDIIVFALSANYSNIPLHITNDIYGFTTVPLDPDEGLQRDLNQLVNIKTHIVNYIEGGIFLNKHLAQYVQYPEKTLLTLSKIYMINLYRRPERREKMEQSFREIGLDVEHFPAVDGATLTDDKIAEMGIYFLPGYADPYHNRPMTTGEIGCFLSHYNIWVTMVENDLNEVLILEDDIRFEPYFVEKAMKVINDARRIGGWDLIYFGRKRLENQDEPWVDDSQVLVHPSYSYWTLGYIITLEGATKLLNAKPLEKLVPVDEFLPIMFDKHANSTWKNRFKNRNLNAWSAAPLILYPTYYSGEDGFISDTEDSVQIKIQTPDGPITRNIDQEKNQKARILKDAIDELWAEKKTDQTVHMEL